tara:strand:+ start:534 stop:842 length:309 start_codon:yes stop_codon:yes gene_type:complete
MISDLFKLKTEFVYASSLQATGKKSSLLINICKQLNINNYYSPKGSKAYIEIENLFNKEKISVFFQDFKQPIYKQLHGEFLPNLSAIDYLFNVKHADLFDLT